MYEGMKMHEVINIIKAHHLGQIAWEVLYQGNHYLLIIAYFI